MRDLLIKDLGWKLFSLLMAVTMTMHNLPEGFAVRRPRGGCCSRGVRGEAS